MTMATPLPTGMQAAELSPDIFGFLDRSGRLTHLNASGLRLMGLAHFEAVRNRPWAGLWPAPVDHQMQAALDAARSGRTVRFRSACATASGPSRCWDITVAPMFDTAGRHQGFMSTARDAASVRHARRLPEMNRHTVATIEHERKALATELHDEMGSVLTLMSLELARARRAATSACVTSLEASLTRLDELVDSLRQYKHRVIAGLRPPLLQELGLEATLQGYVEDFGQRSGIDVRLDVRSPLPSLREEAALALFRVAQESLTNVAKYARATRVRLRLFSENAKVHLEIEDDGCGVDAHRKREHGFGWLGMRERVQALRGRMQVRCAGLQGGTLVAVSLPMTDDIVDQAPCARDANIPALTRMRVRPATF